MKSGDVDALAEVPALASDQCACSDGSRMRNLELFFAAAEGSVEKVRNCLSSKADPNFRDYEQRTALHVAAGAGKSSTVVQLIIEGRANVNLMDGWGQTPLDLSQRAAHYKVELLLKKNGAKMPIGSMQKRAQREKWAIKRSDVQIEAQISQTLKSTVHRAKWRGVDVVAKCILPGAENITPEELESEILHEISMIATIRHPDLVMFLGCCLQESPIMFICEYMPRGDLENYYQSKRQGGESGGPWTPGKVVVNRWARAIGRALNFLHNCPQPIIHRDLKPLNILLTENLMVKITDFGISKATKPYSGGTVSPVKEYASPTKEYSDKDEVGRNSTYMMTGGVGSWRYMAPEVARHQNYTEKVDIYAFGLILYFMSCGRQPFHEFKDITEVLDLYARGDDPRPKASECPKCFRALMEDAWHAEEAKRPKAGDLTDRLEEVRASADVCACAVA